MKRNFALIGHPIMHSISPFIHKRLFEISKLPADYKLIDISPNNLCDSIPILKQLSGYNVTVPLKQNIIPFLDTLSEKANLYGSVNTVKNTSKSCGYNTDSNGFLNALKIENIPLCGNVTILGCGGVARVFAIESILNNCNVTFAVRQQSLTKANFLLNDIKTKTKKNANVTTIDNIPRNIDLLINATPIGMYPNCENIPINESLLKNCKYVFDAIYNPMDTVLIKKAQSIGLKAVSGLSMLVYQAVYAHKIWDDATFCDNDIYQLIYDSKSELNSQFNY